MFMLKIISISGGQDCGSYIRFHLGTQVTGPAATPKLCSDKSDEQVLIIPSDKILIRLKTDETPLIDAQFQLTACRVLKCLSVKQFLDKLSRADHKCHEGLFSCESGKCIHESFVCDGKNQCPGENTDELAENCPVTPPAENTKSIRTPLTLSLLLLLSSGLKFSFRSVELSRTQPA